MNPGDRVLDALLALAEKEARHLLVTAGRLRAAPLSQDWVNKLEQDVAGGELLDAFVARFARLQDTLGDKVLPRLLKFALEPVGAQIENLARAEKLDWIGSADHWVAARTLRNRLIHEYVSSSEDLFASAQAALDAVGLLTDVRNALQQHYASLCQRRASLR